MSLFFLRKLMVVKIISVILRPKMGENDLNVSFAPGGSICK